MEGGSCNDYDYTCGDPVNMADLTGSAQVAIPVVVDEGSFGSNRGDKTIADLLAANDMPKWQQYGLSRCPTKKECQTAVKLLKGAMRYADKYNVRLSDKERGRLKRLIKSGDITRNDAPWIGPEFPGIFGDLRLKEIQEICKDAYGGKW